MFDDSSNRFKVKEIIHLPISCFSFIVNGLQGQQILQRFNIHFLGLAAQLNHTAASKLQS